MKDVNLGFFGGGKAQEAAVNVLREAGICADPGKDADFLLLRVPTRGLLPERIPGRIPVFGGGECPPEIPADQWIDLLSDRQFQQENGVITAQCAVNLLMDLTGDTPEGKNVTILGWGCIGKPLARLMDALGAAVTVYARRADSRAEIRQAGFQTLDAPADVGDVIINTVPFHLLDVSRQDAVYMDLASVPALAGQRVIRALGLPGKMAPEAQGRLIARTVLRYLEEERI